ncbi:hypothetical protein LZ31DRAFT_567461 [Colletotrichum somersetense]|nr:hypothetical protein LZ31DRAFT_567461 [Colletotrichum somersetense]
MDPFNKLPAELRVNIMMSTCCPHTIFQLSQASPDAMAIILFPPQSTSQFQRLARAHCRSWAKQQLANPFREPLQSQNEDFIDKISKPHRVLMFFIEDYLTKAIAIFPPRECLCLSSGMQPWLRFQVRAVSPRFNAANLTGSERKRLLRAFLRYQLLCLIRGVEGYYNEVFYKDAMCQYDGKDFQPWDKEAILCVCTYLKYLYGTIFAQCSGFWLPEVVSGSTSDYPFGLDYPYVDPEFFGRTICDKNSSDLAHLDFDFATVFFRFAPSGQSGQDRLRKWFRDFRPGYGPCGFPRKYQHSNTKYDYFLTGEEDAENGPGMYRILESRVEEYYKLIQTYQQRAWVFFDDARFYPSPSPDEKTHFRTEEVLSQEGD